MASSKKKLSSNSEFVAVNGLYKKLKLSLDEIKVMISELNELENIRRWQQSLLKESQARELKHVFEMCEISKHAIKKQGILKNKYKTETELVEEKTTKLEEELNQTVASCSVIENELMHQNSRIANISSINRQLADFIASAKL